MVINSHILTRARNISQREKWFRMVPKWGKSGGQVGDEIGSVVNCCCVLLQEQTQLREGVFYPDPVLNEANRAGLLSTLKPGSP